MDSKLYQLIKQYNPNSFLDIGANNGEYALDILKEFPTIKVLSIEANTACESDLKNKNLNYIIACPSDKKEVKIFYKTKLAETNTGNSLYKENTHLYTDEHLITEEIQTDTLDNILSGFKDITFDFVKLDTQGSELDILKGATNILNGVKIIICETDIAKYNENCPKQEEIVEYLNSKSFKCLGSIYNHYWNGVMVQQDLVFEKVTV
jgi:FkbM family methyltransferase